MSELLPCPFCGGEAHIQVSKRWPDDAEAAVDGYTAVCQNIDCIMGGNDEWWAETEAEAIEAWNTRAAYEMDGWFYLPKPKEQLFSYTTGFTFDDLSLKSTGTVDVYALTNAVKKWQEESLNQHIIERICEVFKPERTCSDVAIEGEWFECSKCGCVKQLIHPHYCPNCGAKVIEEEE